MKTHTQDSAQGIEAGKEKNLLVLVPHPEIRHRLRAFSAELFSAGLSGAWSFPHVAPLALLSRPLSAPELKQFSKIISADDCNPTDSLELKRGKRVFAEKNLCSSAAFYSSQTASLDIYGPELNIIIPDSAISAIGHSALHWFNPMVIGAALIDNTNHAVGFITEAAHKIPAPECAFTTAALANMRYTILESEAGNSGSFCAWEIGDLHWLPAPGRSNKQEQ